MKLRLLTLAALLVLAPAAGYADEPAGPDIPLPDPATTSGLADATAPTLRGELNLSLADAIEMSLLNNLDVEIQRHEPLITAQDHRGAWGAYDPEWFSEFNYRNNKNPTANALAGTSGGIGAIAPPTRGRKVLDRGVSGSGGLRGFVPWLNTEYNLEFGGSRTKVNSSFVALSPQYDASFALTVTQPLLKDLIWSQPWTRVKTTEIVQMSSLEQFRSDVMDIVRDVEDGYWALIASEDEVRVAIKSFETAEALLDQTQTQYDVGVVSKVEVVEAEAGLAERDLNLIRARNAYENQQDVLFDLILGPGLRPDSNMRVNPTDRPDEIIQYQVDVPDAVQVAFSNRPELEVARKDVERNELEVKFAKNQRLPGLDAIVSYGQKTLSGRENLDNQVSGIAPSPPTRSFGNAVGEFFDKEAGDQFSVGARLTIPIPNRTARAGVSRSELELRRSRVRQRRLEQNIILEVRRAVRDLDSAQQGIGAAERQRIAADEQLRAERIKLEYGESTPFDVLLRERDLVDAENTKIEAFQLYRSSVTGLDRAQGTILRNRNILIDTVRPLR